MKRHTDLRDPNEAPKASRLRGGYGFNKKFPESPDRDGLRPRATDAGLSDRGFRRLLILVCVLVFFFFLTGTVVALKISRLPFDSPAVPAGTTETAVRARILPGADVTGANGTGIVNQCIADGVESVIIEFKTPDGKLFFRPTAEAPADAAQALVTDPAAAVAAFRSAGIRVYGAVACFADDTYARNHIGLSGHSETEVSEADGARSQTSLWYDGTAREHAWLSPGSNEALEYIRSAVSDVADTGVDAVILEYVSLPVEPAPGIIFAGTDAAGINEDMAAFCSGVADDYNLPVGACENGGVFCRYFSEGKTPPLFRSTADFFAVDLLRDAIPGTASFYGIKYDTVNAYEGFCAAAAWSMRDLFLPSSGNAPVTAGIVYTDSGDDSLLTKVTDSSITIVLR